MAKVYSPPEEIKIPELNFSSIKEYDAECARFTEELKQFVLKRNPDKSQVEVGKIIQFPVADGYAQYMIASMKPVELIHMPLWDAWEFQYVERLNVRDIRDKVGQLEAINKLFSKKQQPQ